MSQDGLRIVTFNFLPPAFTLVSDWIRQNNHQHVLTVTTPGPKSRPTPSYIDVVKAAPRDVDLLVSTKMKTVITPVVRELNPDLIFCFSFPYRLTPDLCEIPKFGAINLHPAVLPAYRGPNVFRPFYDNAPIYGATLHWISPEYDTGRILSQKSAPMPDTFDLSSIYPAWGALMAEAMADGAAKALAGDPGVEQDEAFATYAAPFTEEETKIDWKESSKDIQRKIFALNFSTGTICKGMIDGKEYEITGAVFCNNASYPPSLPGTLLAVEDEFMIIQTGDAALKVLVSEIA